MTSKHTPLARQNASNNLEESQSYNPYEETAGDEETHTPTSGSGYPVPKGLAEVMGTGEKTSGQWVYQHPVNKAHICSVSQFHHTNPAEQSKWRSIAASNFRKAEKEIAANQSLVNQWS